MISPDFWQGKRVLLTGHTGFKGTWMALWLENLGADVYGFGLEPETDPSLFNLLSPWSGIKSTIGDVRDAAAVEQCAAEADPEIVIHMAAQALVRRSYREPVDTVASNVMGTVNVLEALRGAKNLKVALVITSDKVYQNTDDGIAFGEDAPLGGDDPYSASKASQEIIAQSWAKSFFADRDVVIATARAGNVVGGGDFSEDRLIPDIYRALASGRNLTLRSPNATRPWQHVLDLNAGYLMYVERLASRSKDTPLALNFGPMSGPSSTVGAITNMMMTALGQDVPLDIKSSKLKEKTLLSVDATRAHEILGWAAKLDVEATVRLTADWYGAFLNGASAKDITARQLIDYGKDQ
ncbi:CDP-glucose 4,6-dehydratase [Magnetovibrio blakemorei]|uniref:CDP-glucose 4,6-dehydratase n=1 Tax=Magnetovibrio blakemorei TaxID=28181 RepID=A0A1E5Q6Z4_9PROT|nr:CDP-glucose 4,6-dehydratase [Magnetovibrio blakemorei]OEJ66682.1 CDP-glucose 4,6-dehydratase [Magnetovibrio blakemorei]